MRFRYLFHREDTDTSPSLPNVLLFTPPCISQAHGMGMTLLRIFADYPPEKLCNVFKVYQGEPSLRNYLWIHPEKGVAPRQAHRPLRVDAVRKELDRTGFVPDVLYAIGYDHLDMDIIVQLIRSYHLQLPTVQHFEDYYTRGKDDEMKRKLANMGLLLTEVWALNESLADEFEPVLARKIPLVNVFNCDIPTAIKTDHRPFSADFRAVMIGNVWTPDLLPELGEAWHWLGTRVNGLRPIEWYCHPAAIERIRKLNIPFEPHIRYGGFLPDDRLFATLRDADIFVVVFNREETPEKDYARYSLPSRITEPASVGLPIFFAGGTQTGAGRYITGTGIGVASTPANVDQFRADLATFVQDAHLRARCGAQARALAEREFDVQKVRQFYQERLQRLARGRRT